MPTGACSSLLRYGAKWMRSTNPTMRLLREHLQTLCKGREGKLNEWQEEAWQGSGPLAVATHMCEAWNR